MAQRSWLTAAPKSRPVRCKDDKMDARMLAKMARADMELLRPIKHRGEKAQLDLTLIRVRAVLVETRTKIVNATRGMVKGFGERLPSCDAMTMGVARASELPEPLQRAFKHLLEEVEALSARIKECDAELDKLAFKPYPETKLLQQASGVGTLISLAFVLTIDDPHRFAKSRDVGCFVGLRPKRSQSGASNPQLGISKEGDRYLRSLLVQGAQYILGWRGPIRTFGAGVYTWPNAAARAPSAKGAKQLRFARTHKRSARLWRWHASWPCSCIACGSPAKSTNR